MILDNLRVHHSKPVKAWLEKNIEKIECFNLPSYNPKLNPEERLNSDLKQAIGSKVQERVTRENACCCQRSHDDAGEQSKTCRFLFSRPTRKIYRLKLFNGRVNKLSFTKIKTTFFALCATLDFSRMIFVKVVIFMTDE